MGPKQLWIGAIKFLETPYQTQQLLGLHCSVYRGRLNATKTKSESSMDHQEHV